MCAAVAVARLWRRGAAIMDAGGEEWEWEQPECTYRGLPRRDPSPDRERLLLWADGDALCEHMGRIERPASEKERNAVCAVGGGERL